MIFRPVILSSVLFALALDIASAEKQKQSYLVEGEQRNLRTIKTQPSASTETSDAENMRSEDFKGIWRSLQSDTSMPLEIPSPSPTQSAPIDLPSSPPTQSPVVPRTEPPTTAPTNVPMMTVSETPSVLPSRSPTSAPIVVTSPSQEPTLLENAVPSDIPSLMPSTITLNSTDRPTLPPTFPCNSSPELRDLLMKVQLMGLSDEIELDTEGTPQNEAFRWISGRDPNYLCPNDPKLSQRYSLAVFYYATNGNRWSQCVAPVDVTDESQVEDANQRCNLVPLPDTGSNAWLTPGDECDWAGIVCNRDGFVERIDIERNGLAGTMASELRHLSGLKVLSLENGVISGVIPSELGALDSLEVIDLNFNLIGGSIPTEIYSISTLRQLDLNDNVLTGTIPPAIGDLRNLTFLQLHQNEFEGTIPSELGQLSLLEAASFEFNDIDGSMPDSVCMLVSDGALQSLSSDCLTGFQCDCCTQCF